MKKNILLIIGITFCLLLIFSFDNPIRRYIVGTLDFPFMLQIVGHSIERDGLEGCDTVPLPGDKEQIAYAFMANVDTIWRTLYKVDKNVSYDNKNKYVDDPSIFYSMLCFRDDFKNHTTSLLSESPKNVYEAFTDLVLYSKDKLLCMAFVVIRQDYYDGRSNDELPPYFRCFVVLGKRKNREDKFKIFLRFGVTTAAFGSADIKVARMIENTQLYTRGETYDTRDVYPVEDEWKLPLPSDPDFFEKHPLFEKFDDSTYNFEWYKTEGTPEKYYRYDYPY